MEDNENYFEENDDPRTQTGELVEDCKKGSLKKEKKIPESVLEYLGEFKGLIDICGQVSYFYNMSKYVSADVNKAKIVAAAYQHDLEYYNDQLNEWRVKGRIAFGVLGLHARKLGYEMPDQLTFLNDLATSKDRRKAYKGYIDTLMWNAKTLSPTELEAKYQDLLRKRFFARR